MTTPQKRVAASPARSRVGKLSPGDTIEVGLTTAVKHPRQGEWWIKIGTTTTIRDGESATAALERAKGFVADALDEAVREVLS